jgi:hypothetical protein
MDDLAIAKRCGEKLWETDAALRVLGISVEVTDTGSAEAKFEVRPDMLNGHGVCHGGRRNWEIRLSLPPQRLTGEAESVFTTYC